MTERALKKRYVIFTGAGANSIYGYPTGEQLANMILASFEDARNPDFQAVLGLIGNEESIVDFRRTFWDSEDRSIDAFLRRFKNRDPHFHQIGKLAVALNLLKFETDTNLFRNSLSEYEHWYKFLFDQLNDALDGDWLRLQKGDFTIFTFNYDRSMEFFFYRKLKALTRLSDEEIKKVIDKMRFHHFHGHLGYLPFYDSRGRPYNHNILGDMEVVKSVAQSINMAWEDENYRREGRIIGPCDELDTADEILILGFGFHPENMALMTTEKGGYWNSNNRQKAVARASGVGILPGKQMEIQGHFGALVGLEKNLSIADLLKTFRIE